MQAPPSSGSANDSPETPASDGVSRARVRKKSTHHRCRYKSLGRDAPPPHYRRDHPRGIRRLEEEVLNATNDMSIIVHIRYTIDMTITDRIYDAVDDFGLITSAEAKEIGVPNAELVQQARRGKLVRVARGVYRMPIWPYQEMAPYAIAVKSVGSDARLFGESVIALLGLAPTNPGRMWVASPRRARRSVGEDVCIARCRSDDPVRLYDGVPSQPVADAIASAVATMGVDRAMDAAEEALRQGYITKTDHNRLSKELGT